MVSFLPMIAESTTPAQSIQTTLSTGLSQIASDMQTTVVTILPVILGVVGLVMVVSFAIRFFRNNVRSTC